MEQIIQDMKKALKGDGETAQNFIEGVKEEIETGKVSKQTMIEMRSLITKESNIDALALMYWTKFEFYLYKRL